MNLTIRYAVPADTLTLQTTTPKQKSVLHVFGKCI